MIVLSNCYVLYMCMVRESELREMMLTLRQRVNEEREEHFAINEERESLHTKSITIVCIKKERV